MAAMRTHRFPTFAASRNQSLAAAASADGPRLRNSCSACASSKLKCSQEKPVCSRCAKRQTICEYVAAKPAGRKITVNRCDGDDLLPTNDATRADQDLPSSPPHWAVTPTMINVGHAGLFDDGVICSPGTSTENTGSNLNLTCDLFGDSPEQLIGSVSDVAPPDNSPNYFDAAFAEDFSEFATSLSEFDNGHARDTIFEDTIPGPFGVAPMHSHPFHPLVPITETFQRSAEISETRTSPPCQLPPTYRILEQLSCESPRITSWTSAQSVLKSSRMALESIDIILKSDWPCDGYELALIILALFKILDRFQMMAGQAHEMLDRQGSDTDFARMTGQAILGELYLVRRLTVQLAARPDEILKNSLRVTEMVGQPQDHKRGVPSALVVEMNRTLVQRLRVLSADVVKQLRAL